MSPARAAYPHFPPRDARVHIVFTSACMTVTSQAWGTAPSSNYDAIADRFRPIFAKIAEGAVRRERERILPHEEIGWLKAAGFGAVRVPVAEGGLGATLPDLFGLIIELADADSNLAQGLRSHFGWSEHVVTTRDPARRKVGIARLLAGDLAGNAWTEIGESSQTAFSTTVRQVGDRWLLNGTKYYTTGSLFADWIDVGATDGEGRDVGLLVRRSDPGVAIADDWDGFGQILTASGTTVFKDAVVDPADIVLADTKFRYGAAFYQLVHLATLAGIGRAVTRDVAKAVAGRRRTFTNAAGPRSSQDPQVLQVVGRIRGAAWSAGALALYAAAAVEAAHRAHFSDDDAANDLANVNAELEVAQAQNVVIDLVLGAATAAFDALSASATKGGLALDRHWRNARTLASHNPRIYKERIIGDFAVNGTPPPFQWRIGLAPAA